MAPRAEGGLSRVGGSDGGNGSAGAVLLAGGRASRMGGVAKPLLDVGGRSLLRAAVDAVAEAGAHPITVAAPVLDPALPVAWVREDPPFGGPAAGIVAALSTWDEDPHWTFVIACDLARPGLAVARLVDAARLVPADTDGVCLGDAASRPQWLTAIYRTDALRKAASALPRDGRDASVRALVDDLAVAVVAAPDATDDIDTWEDLNRAKERSDG